MIKRILLLLAVLWLSPVHAQSLTKLCFPTGTQGGTRTTCQEVTLANPLPITGVNVSIGSLSISALNAVSATITNTTAAPVFVSNPNGFGGNGTVTQGTNPWIISTPNTVNTNIVGGTTLSVSTLTVQNLATGASLNVLDTNSAALLAAAQAGTATYGAANPSSGISNGLDGLSSEQTKGTTGNIISAMGDLVGKTVTSPYANRENFLSCAVTITSTSGTTCTGMGAQGASVKIYITDLCITRSDAGTTAITATIGDSATSKYDIPNNGGGGGVCKTYNVPLQVAANTAFIITMSNAVTSANITASGFKGY